MKSHVMIGLSLLNTGLPMGFKGGLLSLSCWTQLFWEDLVFYRIREILSAVLNVIHSCYVRCAEIWAEIWTEVALSNSRGVTLWKLGLVCWLGRLRNWVKMCKWLTRTVFWALRWAVICWLVIMGGSYCGSSR